MENEDIELIKEYLDGNQGSLKILIERYTPLVFNFSKRFAHDDASDISQEVFIKVWKNIKKFDADKASFKTWLFKITRNTVTDYLRKRKNIVFSELDSEDSSWADKLPDDTMLQDEEIQKIQDKEFLSKLLDDISPSSREVLILYYQEDMTFSEISIVLDKPLNTVKSIHRRAILELRRMIKDFAPKY